MIESMKGRHATLAFLFATVLTSLVSWNASAATWRVEKDGSGDFTVIQDAVDAAADGDVIQIGPGRFDDFESNEYGVWRIVLIEDKSLTFVGAGAGQTFLGPENFGDIASQYVYCIYVNGEGLETRLRNMTLENVQRWGIRLEYEGRLEVDDCVFRTSGGGVYGYMRDGGWIRNCEFIDNSTVAEYSSVNLSGQTIGFTVENSGFVDCDAGISAYWAGSQDITVRECTFVGGQTGVAFVDGASGSVVDCEFTGQARYGIIGSSVGSLTIEGNVVDQTGADSYCFCVYYPPGDYTLRDNVFSGDVKIMGIFTPLIDLDCRDNHFLRTGPEAWYIRPANSAIYDGPDIHLDFTLNWWGTDDAEEVATWIYDGNDDPEYHYIIDFLPMAGGSVQVESRSWSGVRGMFRR